MKKTKTTPLFRCHCVHFGIDNIVYFSKEGFLLQLLLPRQAVRHGSCYFATFMSPTRLIDLVYAQCKYFPTSRA